MERTMRTLKAILLLLMVTMATYAQEQNKLFVPDVTGAESSTITLPISLSNTSSDIVAMQFDLSVPEDVMTVTMSSPSLTERKEDHEVNISNRGGGQYRVMVHSPSNKPFKANSGEVLGIQVKIANEVDHDSVFTIGLQDVVLGDSKGNNVVTETANGTFMIRPSVDFVVSDISMSPASVMPGDTIDISWAVKNQGNMASEDGWSEKVYFVAKDGTEKVLGTYYGETKSLATGGEEKRTAKVALPALLGMDGDVNIKVTLYPYSESGEDIAYQKNNTTETEGYVYNIGKRLLMELPAKAIEEGSSSAPVRCTLSRSGSWSADQTFTLAKLTEDSRLTVPESVTIPQGEASTYFYITVANNEVLDDDSVAYIQVSGGGYEALKDSIVIEDDEYPQLTVKASKDEVTEGDAFQLTVTTQRASRNPISVKLVSEASKRFTYPSTVTIPAGETSVTVDVTAVDNDEVELSESFAFKVSAAKHEKGECLVLLNDNDLPAIDLELTPTSVSESAGLVAIVAKIKRTTNADKKVTVQLSDDSENGDIYYPSKSVVLDAGVEETQFSLGVVDNANVDGDRKVNITAAIYVSSCNCSAQGSSVGSVTKELEIIDNDGPSLSVTSSKSTLLEGNEDGIVLTIKRNTSTDADLTVNLSSDSDEGLTYDHTVTIPAGKESVDVTVKASENSSSGDDKTIVFTVEATDFSKGTCWVMLTDQTLPDVQVTSVSLSKTEAEVGSSVDVSVTISNIGAAELPEVTKIGVYLSNNSSSPVANLYNQQPLAPGEQVTLTKTITLPSDVGSYEVYAVANDGNAVKELLTVNNTSEKVAVKTTAPFTATVSTDKDKYQQGEAVTISGSVTGSAVANKEVEVYVMSGKLRQTIAATTDANGKFTATFQPYSAQMGHFIAGACYPGENLKDEMAAFDVYGLKCITGGSYIKCETLVGQAYTDKVTLSNPGTLSLSDVKVTVQSKPENCNVEVKPSATTIEGGGRIDINYTLTGSAASEGDDWELIDLLVETKEGASWSTTLYYYCRSTKGQLKANVSEIKTTMIKGSSRDYPLQITNVGKGETGKITLAMPEWMTTATPSEIASLAPGDTTTIMLRFTPTEDMQLNNPVKGTMGINCENGDGLPLSYSVEPVSESKGTLVIDVCDEYTYNTSEAPHVSGAQVLIKHPVTGAIISQGTTDENGLYTIELAEGYYAISVTADKHDSYKNNILVDPGKENVEEIFLGFNAITYSWNVEETEIEDEYKITTTVKYETNVPMPVVKMDMPKRIDGDSMQVGDVTMIDVTLTNVGLIKAEEVAVLIPEDMPEWQFEGLDYMEPFVLLPQQSVKVPVRITRIADGIQRRYAKAKSIGGDLIQNYGTCMTAMGLRYKYQCGTDLKENKYAEALAMKTCAYSATVQTIMEIISRICGNGPGSPGGSGGGGGGASEYYGDIKQTLNICDTCDAKKIKTLVDRGLSFTFLGTFDGALNKAIEEFQENRDPDLIYVVKDINNNILETGREEILDHYGHGKVNTALSLGEIIVDVYKLTEKCGDEAEKPKTRSSSKRDWVEEFNQVGRTYIEQLSAIDTLLLYAYGDRVWFEDMDEEKMNFLEYMRTLPEGNVPTVSDLTSIKPSSVTMEQVNAYVDYVINGKCQNILTLQDIEDQFEVILNCKEIAVENGFDSMTEYFKNSYETYRKRYEDMASNSVCATISLQIKQTMTMTRQAFRGTLTVFNGNEEKAMENVRLNLEVRDEEGNLATDHEFQINAEDLDGFAGKLDLTSGWTLAANETGTATILFIPTKYAALTEDKKYSFGGTLSYVDPFTGLEVTRDLFPVPLTVKPSPNLDLTYFMQRDVYGDDPLTADVVEPCEPAEFALLINNKGYGDATNVRMVTNQPEIVDNEKGLLIDFELVSSQVNGKDKTLSFGQSIANDFGTISASSTAYAQWWLQSSLLGHFTDYDVKATHVTSYGNEDLSLLDNVTIHELIHGFTANEKADPVVRGFLVNDIPDADDAPDMVYFTDGSQELEVKKASVSMTKTSDTEYTVTMTPSQSGWCYGSTVDLTAGRQKLTSVRKSDGTELPADNFWLTDRTLRDGKDPLYEYRLHAVVNLTGEETFTLTFEPKPDVELEVEKFTGVPEEGKVLETQLKSVNVIFNKAIREETFTEEDLTLSCQGKSMDVSKVAITKVSDTEYAIDLSGVTLQSGYYVLTVQTAGIMDSDGFEGSTGKNTSWTQNAVAKVTLTVVVSPEEAGEVSPGTTEVDFGSEVTLTAVPNPGYQFDGWFDGENELGKETTYSHTMTADILITAKFSAIPDGIDINLRDLQGMDISPLPLRDVMYVDGDFTLINRLVVVDANGASRIEKTDLARGSAVDVSSLPQGIYVVKAVTDNGTFVKKVYKK